MVQMKEGKGGGACHGVLVEVDEVSREDKGSRLAARGANHLLPPSRGLPFRS